MIPLTSWLLGLALGLQQDVGFIFVQEWKNAGQTTISTTQIYGTRLHQDSGVDSDREIQIFDAVEHILRSLDPVHRTYIEVKQEDVSEDLKRAITDAEAAKYIYRRKGNDRVGQWACTSYDVLRPASGGGIAKESEVCLADLSQFGMTVSDISASRELFEFGWRYSLSPSAAPVAEPPKFPLTETSEMSGVPVRRVWFTADGSIATSSELKEFRKEAIPPFVFDVPPQFAKLSSSSGVPLDHVR